MKKIIHYILIAAVIFSACKKQSAEKPVIETKDSQVNYAFITAVHQYTQLQVQDSDYRNIDFRHYRISKQGRHWYTRLPFKNKSLNTDFVLLQSDSAGTVMAGRIIHLALPGGNNGRVGISLLDRSENYTSAIINGYIERFHPDLFAGNIRGASLPDPYDELPEVIVVGYHAVVNEGSSYSIGSFMSLQNLFTSGGGSGGGGSSDTYATSGGNTPYSYIGGYYPNGYGYNGETQAPTTENMLPADVPDIAFTPDNSYLRPAIDLNAWMKCFTDVPDQGAVCKITLLGDLPVDTDPSIGLNIWSGNTGHCFLQLSKTNGAQSVTQIIGFTAENPFRAIINSYAFVEGKTVDNAGHKYDCSITMNLNSTGFNTVIDKMKSLSAAMPYSVVNYDCLDYALDIFNVVRPANPLVIPKVYSANDPFSNIGTGPKLYSLLQDMITGGSAEAPNIMLGGPLYAGVSHGPCN